MNKKPIFTYKENGLCFELYLNKTMKAVFEPHTSEQFVKWLVDLLNEHYEKFSVERSEKLLKEMGF